MIEENTPIIIGADLVVQKEKDVTKAMSPLDLLVKAAVGAVHDAVGDHSASEHLISNIDSVAGLRFITDSPEASSMPFGKYPNPGLSVAKRLGMTVSNSFYAPTGGNTPQFMIGDLAKRIHAGEIKSSLLVGGEIQMGL
jgi:acetyl-CoA C-acetyltransferase